MLLPSPPLHVCFYLPRQDVATNAMTISFEMHLDSLVLQTAKNTRIAKRSAKSVANVKFPALLDRTGRIKGKDTLAQTDVSDAATAATCTNAPRTCFHVHTQMQDRIINRIVRTHAWWGRALWCM